MNVAWTVAIVLYFLGLIPMWVLCKTNDAEERGVEHATVLAIIWPVIALFAAAPFFEGRE